MKNMFSEILAEQCVLSGLNFNLNELHVNEIFKLKPEKRVNRIESNKLKPHVHFFSPNPRQAGSDLPGSFY